MKSVFLPFKRYVVVAVLLAMTGCASTSNMHADDPLEPMNRAVFGFNEGLDQAVVKPVATAYRDNVPSPVRTGVGNFFANLQDLWSAFNGALQARPQQALENLMRFNLNTFFGFAGLIDLATEFGMPRTVLDFGQTLGRWGLPSGPYLVLPVLGPSSVRDAVGRVVDAQADPVTGSVQDVPVRNSLYALRLTDQRADLLRATDLLDQIALDKYAFTRDAYLQRRRNQIEDAELPE